MPTVKPPGDEIAELALRNTESFTEIMLRLIAAEFGTGNQSNAVDDLAQLIAETMTLSDLLARKRLLAETDEIEKTQSGKFASPRVVHFATEISPVVPHVPFEDALDDLLSREPRLAPGYQAVQEVYREHGFALARSSRMEVTERAQQLIESFIRSGQEPPSAKKAVAELGPWGQAYGEVVYRTNMTTAYTAGRMQEARSEHVREVIGAFEYQTAKAVNVRKNHKAAEGLVADTNDQIWVNFAPPLGYNCRCWLRSVPRSELKRRGLLDESGQVRRFEPPSFSAAYPDPGFEDVGESPAQRVGYPDVPF